MVSGGTNLSSVLVSPANHARQTSSLTLRRSSFDEDAPACEISNTGRMMIAALIRRIRNIFSSTRLEPSFCLSFGFAHNVIRRLEASSLPAEPQLAAPNDAGR